MSNKVNIDILHCIDHACELVHSLDRLDTDAERKSIIVKILRKFFCLECGAKITKEKPNRCCTYDDKTTNNN